MGAGQIMLLLLRGAKPSATNSSLTVHKCKTGLVGKEKHICLLVERLDKHICCT
jgi:hypothetical protein